MGSLATIGLFVVVVLTAFGTIGGFATAVVIERLTNLDRAQAAAAGTAAWVIGSGAPLTLILVRWAAPSPDWPHWSYDWQQITATFVGTISVAGGVLGGLTYLLSRRRR